MIALCYVDLKNLRPLQLRGSPTTATAASIRASGRGGIWQRENANLGRGTEAKPQKPCTCHAAKHRIRAWLSPLARGGKVSSLDYLSATSLLNLPARDHFLAFPISDLPCAELTNATTLQGNLGKRTARRVFALAQNQGQDLESLGNALDPTPSSPGLTSHRPLMSLSFLQNHPGYLIPWYFPQVGPSVTSIIPGEKT